MSLAQASVFNQATTGTTRSATFGNNVAVGELVVAFLSYENGSDLTVTWGNSGTATVDAWTEVANLDQFDAGDSNGQECAYARVTGAGTLTVTATIGSAPAWGGIGICAFDSMPGTLELQDSQYDSVTIQNPDGTDMTPTSQPAMVIGIGVRWGSPLETPGVDTAAGFTDGGAGATYTGTALMRIEYQQITSTTPLDIEFTTTNTGRFYVNGLIFTEASGLPPGPPSLIKEIWRGVGA